MVADVIEIDVVQPPGLPRQMNEALGVCCRSSPLRDYGMVGRYATGAVSKSQGNRTRGTTLGVKINSVTVNSDFGTGFTSVATLDVVATPPTITKAFGAPIIPLNDTTSLTFAINNPNPTTSLAGVGFSDTLPAGLVLATPNGLSGSCGGGTIVAIAGSAAASLTGATLAASA
jgi:uncharacterized repeat protein (TIGR01451 family)